ncbi:unnamed protein product [Clavelina lepadiformis]|uniref:PiggyBac transposable element-derived protein 4 C-terminal zinc-ribbon domain-containing protein n=1 Tax=Clavelina lepadiformis TaxID=159417 RepID=A0ABP0G6W0_CLALP
MPSVEARTTNRMMMRNRFLRAAVEMVLGRPIATSPEGAEANPKEPHGNRGATPIVGSCYVCRDQKRKRRKTRKGCVACVQPVCDEHSITKKSVLLVTLTKPIPTKFSFIFLCKINHFCTLFHSTFKKLSLCYVYWHYLDTQCARVQLYPYRLLRV